MKTPPYKLLKTIGFVFLAALTIAACKKSDDTTTPATTTTSTTGFSFKVDGGAAIIVDSAKAYLYTSNKLRMMDIYAFKGGKEILEFHFDPKAGTKTAGTTLGTGAFLTYMETPTSSFDSQSGQLNLTTCDTTGKKIEGDFNFVAKTYPYTGSTVKTITEGHMIVTKVTK